MSRKFTGCILLLLILVLSVPGRAAVQLEAGYLNYAGDSIEVSKGVTVRKNEVTIKAPAGVFYREENRARLREGVEMDYDEGTIRGQEMTGWLDEDRYVFTENVALRHRVRENEEMTLNSPYLEISKAGENTSFQAREGVTIDYEQKILKAAEADYDGQNEQLVLTGDVYIEKENGDWIKGKKATFFLGSEEEEFTVDGQVEVELNITGD